MITINEQPGGFSAGCPGMPAARLFKTEVAAMFDLCERLAQELRTVTNRHEEQVKSALATCTVCGGWSGAQGQAPCRVCG